MKKIIFFITVIIIITFILSRREAPATPVNPSPVPSLTPSSTPKTFKFDGSTDLREELDKIDPQVLDSDFNE